MHESSEKINANCFYSDDTVLSSIIRGKNCRQIQELLQEEASKELRLAEIEDKKKRNIERYAVMNKNKGLYYYTWTHERKTWYETTQRLLFDFGCGELFEWVNIGITIP